MSADGQRVLERDLPDYTVDSILGRGATSTVYRAVQKTLGRYVAIKRFAPETRLSEGVSKRFEREAAMWAHFKHENLIHLYDYRMSGSTRYIILEYCDGFELRELLSKTVTLPARVATAIGIQALTALEYLHRYGVVHRDVKPGNLFVTSEGIVKLMDFGISLCPELEPMTQPGQILGTPAYMSPEQSLGQEINFSSDLFSFGVVLFEMLEGCTPFRASTLQEAIEEVRKGKYAKPSRKHPGPLRDLIGKCLHKKVTKRISSATEARRKLERYLSQVTPQGERVTIRKYLLEEGMVSPEFHLFPKGVTETTVDGPLATAFSAIKETEIEPRVSRLRPYLLLLLALALLGEVYFGHPSLRPDWITLWEVLASAGRFAASWVSKWM
ncbi:MAG TPA: serine/threonine-protein kinase [Bdellovibrionota bacterium]|nr:serine/threonine-protein kinase [Bdellovibrionota bacterium]